MLHFHNLSFQKPTRILWLISSRQRIARGSCRTGLMEQISLFTYILTFIPPNRIINLINLQKNFKHKTCVGYGRFPLLNQTIFLIPLNSRGLTGGCTKASLPHPPPRFPVWRPQDGVDSRGSGLLLARVAGANSAAAKPSKGGKIRTTPLIPNEDLCPKGYLYRLSLRKSLQLPK